MSTDQLCARLTHNGASDQQFLLLHGCCCRGWKWSLFSHLSVAIETQVRGHKVFQKDGSLQEQRGASDTVSTWWVGYDVCVCVRVVFLYGSDHERPHACDSCTFLRNKNVSHSNLRAPWVHLFVDLPNLSADEYWNQQTRCFV